MHNKPLLLSSGGQSGTEELKKSQGKPEVKIYGLPEDTSSLDNGNSGKKASYEKIYSDEKVVPYNSGVIVIGDTAYELHLYTPYLKAARIISLAVSVSVVTQTAI